MQITVRLFGSIREATGAKELGVDLAEGATTDDVRALLRLILPLWFILAARH